MRRKHSSFAAAAALLALTACGVVGRRADPPRPAVVLQAPAEPEPPRVEPVPVLAAAPVEPGPDRAAAPEDWAHRTLAGMTIRQKVAQMMMVWMLGDFDPAGSATELKLRELVETQGVGGIIVSAGTPTEVAVKLNELQEHAATPLLVGADLESGAGFRLSGVLHIATNLDMGGATDFPFQMALGAIGDEDLAYQMGRITALEARAVGIHVPFAPILDVNSNPDNPIIGVRSFGEDPQQVARLGAAFVRGVQDNGAIAVGKHFPGHGATDVNSHLALPVIHHSRAHLDSVDLVPFRAAIEAGMGGIMTAHITVPALENGGNLPATLSPDVMTGVLREQLGYRGLVFTDAMDMGAIDNGFGRSEAPVRAVLAGADVILMPPSAVTAIEALVAAVEGGRIPESRIDESVLRILGAKQSLGLATDPKVSPGQIHRVVGIPANVAVAREIAERSLVLLRNGRDLLPLAGTSTARVMSVTFRRASDLLAGRWFNETLRATYPALVTQSADRAMPRVLWEQMGKDARKAQLVVVSVYQTPWDPPGLPEELSDFIEELGRRKVPHVVVAFGNPYMITRFPDIQAYLLAWSGTAVAQRAAARALVGKTPINGRTPTRIPPAFEIGAGITLPARTEP
ncbi:MAG: glycoside hydrolase family 3 protein [Gemmatimonadetes bacterium]|nr:glycoside hydrolase family 3 protein [Gemmatimonadota bacterium]